MLELLSITGLVAQKTRSRKKKNLSEYQTNAIRETNNDIFVMQREVNK